MRLIFALLTAVGLMLPSAAPAGTQADVGVRIEDGAVRSFHIAIGEYFDVPEREVIIIRERHIPDYEIPVVYHIVRHAHVRPEVIIEYRLRGHSWMDVTLHFGLGPDIYYVPVHDVYGPPYGKAYGHYKNKHKNEWKKIVLDDDDVVNFVNLRFISERYGYSPDEVIRLRSSGKDFFVINDEVRRGHGDKGRHGDRDHGKDRKGDKDKHKHGHDD